MNAKYSMRMPVILLSLVMGLLILAMPAQAQGLCEDFQDIDNPDDATIREYQRECVTESKQESKAAKGDEESSYRPPDITCPHLPDHVLVYGYVENTQCQMVGEVAIAGHPELQERGFIDAVDVWSVVPENIEVCFHDVGWLVFLDAAYAPRMAMELEHRHRDGMHCGRIDRQGTVVLLSEAAPPASPTMGDAAVTLPVFEAIPLSDCQIKLAETLFLRARPGGEIIGLVWLNSEVPAFEINGYWYKVEFEGKTGYISRFHRRVLNGGCG